MADEVLRERRGHVEILTINRPEARNAINGAVSLAMSGVMDELAEDADCWVVVITGAATRPSAPAWTSRRSAAARAATSWARAAASPA